ncbi:MAG: hypothetical protein ACTSXP_08515 [Promethearchaeota archaeon]
MHVQQWWVSSPFRRLIDLLLLTRSFTLIEKPRKNEIKINHLF